MKVIFYLAVEEQYQFTKFHRSYLSAMTYYEISHYDYE